MESSCRQVPKQNGKTKGCVGKTSLGEMHNFSQQSRGGSWKRTSEQHNSNFISNLSVSVCFIFTVLQSTSVSSTNQGRYFRLRVAKHVSLLCAVRNFDIDVLLWPISLVQILRFSTGQAPVSAVHCYLYRRTARLGGTFSPWDSIK